MNAGEPRPNTFVHRVLWWLALLGLVHGGVDVLGLFVTIKDFNLPFPYLVRGADRGFTLFMAGYLGSLGAGLVLIVGSVGLLRWKGWARPLLMAWVLMFLPLSLLSAVGNVVMIHARLSATTQGSMSPMPYIVFNFFATLILRSVFPIFVLAIMWQREVMDLWSRQKYEGFAVIPMAKPADDQAQK